MDGWVALISGVTGIIAGGFGATVAPWAQWGVDKRRGLRDSRIDMLKRWRIEIAQLKKVVDEYRSAADVTDYDPDYQYYPLKEAELKRAMDVNTQQWYHYLLDALDKDQRTKLEADLRKWADEMNGEPAIAALSKAVALVARKWELT